MARTKPLPGMEEQIDSELETLAENYVEKRDARMALTEEECDSRDVLIAAMKERKRKIYKHGDLTIEVLSGKDKVKVRKKDKEAVSEDPEASSAE